METGLDVSHRALRPWICIRQARDLTADAPHWDSEGTRGRLWPRRMEHAV